MIHQEHLWGIDLGGTKIEGLICHRHGAHDPIERQRLDTESASGYDHIIARIVELVDLLSKKSGLPIPTRIGVAAPGTTDPHTGLLKNSNTVCLNGRPLQADLQDALGRPVIIENDANCFALAEATLGAAVEHPSVFGVILGTGVGGGLVIHKKILPGRHGIAGEWGHNVLDENGASCYCGKKGCVETVLSGPSLEKFYAAASGQKLPLPDIASRVATDPAAAATIDRLTAQFARALAVVINILDPHAIVIGGGVSQIDALYTPQTRAKIAATVFHDSFTTPILKPKLGASAGVFGAALLTHELTTC